MYTESYLALNKRKNPAYFSGIKCNFFWDKKRNFRFFHTDGQRSRKKLFWKQTISRESNKLKGFSSFTCQRSSILVLDFCFLRGWAETIRFSCRYKSTSFNYCFLFSFCLSGRRWLGWWMGRFWVKSQQTCSRWLLCST